MNWYVIYVRGGKEQEVVQQLTKIGWNAFCPRMEVLYRKQSHTYLATKLMFPNYVFVKSDDSFQEFHAKFVEMKHKIKGIVKEMKYDNEGTSPLFEDEIAFLEQILDDTYVMRHSIGDIHDGKTYIYSGSLQGLEQYIKKIDRHKRRALLEISLHKEVKQLYVSLEIKEKN